MIRFREDLASWVDPLGEDGSILLHQGLTFTIMGLSIIFSHLVNIKDNTITRSSYSSGLRWRKENEYFGSWRHGWNLPMLAWKTLRADKNKIHLIPGTTPG